LPVSKTFPLIAIGNIFSVIAIIKDHSAVVGKDGKGQRIVINMTVF
jgi:hypothetical protein